DLIGSGIAVRKRRARRAPGIAAQLVVIADDAIDFVHRREHFRLDLPHATGHHGATLRTLTMQLADRLSRLRHSLAGHRTGVDDNDTIETGICGPLSDNFGFMSVEPA